LAGRGSCAKRTFVGCLGCGGILTLLGLFFGAGFIFHEPLHPVFTTIEEGFAVAETNEAGLNLPNGDAPAPKPVRLRLDVEAADLKVRCNAPSEKVEVGGNYDKANFDLDHEVTEHEEYTDYHIRFRPKGGFSRMWSSIDENSQSNSLDIWLPQGLLLALDLHTKLGSVDLELGGLAVSGLDVDHSMGEFELRMNEPNRVAMDRMSLKTSISNATVFDLQNLDFRHGRVESSVGELLISNSGDFQGDMNLDLEMTLGDARLEVPDNVRVEASTRVMIGESRTPSSRDKENTNYVLRINGGVTIGEHQVVYRTRLPELHEASDHKTSDLDLQEAIWDSFLRVDHTKTAIEEYRRISLSDPNQYVLGKEQFIKIGKKLLKEERLNDAVLTFSFAAELYPDYADAYDYLGEAFDLSGETDQALIWYKKSLELEPDNNYTRRKVRRMQEENL